MAVVVGALVLGPAAPNQAAPATTVGTRASIPQGAWEGTSTDVKGDFSYGRV